MSCCNKRNNKEKVKQIMERRRFEHKAFDDLRSMKIKIPSTLNDNLLAEYHRKCHMLYAQSIQYQPPNIVFVNQIVELHSLYVKETRNRGIKHNTTLQRI